MNGSPVWMVAAVALAVSLVPAGIACFRKSALDRLVALEMADVTVTMLLVVLAEAFGRSMLLDLALALAVLSFGGGLVFARFLERWV